MVLRWGTHSQHVDIWWYEHLVVLRWGKHGAYFRKWATPVGPHQNTTLAPAYRPRAKPSIAPGGQPRQAQCGSPAWAQLRPMWMASCKVTIVTKWHGLQLGAVQLGQSVNAGHLSPGLHVLLCPCRQRGVELGRSSRRILHSRCYGEGEWHQQAQLPFLEDYRQHPDRCSTGPER